MTVATFTTTRPPCRAAHTPQAGLPHQITQRPQAAPSARLIGPDAQTHNAFSGRVQLAERHRERTGASCRVLCVCLGVHTDIPTPTTDMKASISASTRQKPIDSWIHFKLSLKIRSGSFCHRYLVTSDVPECCTRAHVCTANMQCHKRGVTRFGIHHVEAISRDT